MGTKTLTFALLNPHICIQKSMGKRPEESLLLILFLSCFLSFEISFYSFFCCFHVYACIQLSPLAEFCSHLRLLNFFSHFRSYGGDHKAFIPNINVLFSCAMWMVGCRKLMNYETHLHYRLKIPREPFSITYKKYYVIKVEIGPTLLHIMLIGNAVRLVCLWPSFHETFPKVAWYKVLQPLEYIHLLLFIF